MVTCLFVAAQVPLSPQFGAGGPAVIYERLASLCALGHHVHLWHYAYPDARRAFDEFVAQDPAAWTRVVAMCDSVTLTTFPARASLSARVANRLRNTWSYTFVENPLFRSVGAGTLRGLMRRVRPDVVWAETFGPAQIALLQSTRPVVYSHHDWLYRVRAIGRAVRPDERQQRIEEQVARAATVVVSGSAVERTQLERLGCRQVAYIPPSYEQIGRAHV